MLSMLLTETGAKELVVEEIFRVVVTQIKKEDGTILWED